MKIGGGGMVGLILQPSAVVVAATTWDPLFLTASTTLDATHLIATMSGVGNAGTRSVGVYSSGKIYCEFIATTVVTPDDFQIAFANASAIAGEDLIHSVNGGAWRGGGLVNIGNGANTTFAASFAQGDNCGIALDFVNQKIWCRANGGNWHNDVIANQNPALNIGGGAFSSVTGPYYITWSCSDNNTAITAKFSSTSWTYAAPAGFSQPT